jgi:hypothetical protein
MHKNAFFIGVSSLSKVFRLEHIQCYMLLNIINMKRYKSFTPGGLYFHLSLSAEGVCCVVVYDLIDCDLQIKYFTNSNKALRFINNL